MRLVPILVLSMLAAPAAAQSGEGTDILVRAKLAETVEANFKRIDADSDGAVTREELDAAQRKVVEEASARAERRFAEEFRRLDTNKDGMLNIAEFTAAAPDARAKASADSRIEKFDSNRDGKVTLDEFRTPVLANFDRIDSDRDGLIEAEEQKAALARSGR